MSGNEEPAAVDWLADSGEMGKLIRSMDWSKTPLGPIESWSQSLRTTVSLCLASNFPISIAWGQERVLIYNDGYWPICGEKHPHSMGQDFKECWLSAWDAIGESFERASAGQAAFLENQRMFVDRNGYLEEAFFTFSFSPIRDETGGVGGLFHPLTEQTQQTLAERRLKVLRDLADRTADAKTIEQACGLMTQALAAHELDLPFTLFYLLDADGKQARLVGNTGLEPGSAACPTVVDLEASLDGWALAEVARSGQAQQVDELEERFNSLACGPYPESPKSALVMPISLLGLEHPLGLFVAGVSPRRALDEAYQTFYKMLGESVTSALANARTYEEERKRAEALAELDRAKTTFFSNVSHEWQEAETARQEVETILSSINDSFFVLDRNWRYTYVNDRNCELIGMKREELLGQSIWNLFPDVVGTEVYGQFQRVMTEQTLTQFEYFYPTWRRWFEYRVYPSLDGITVFIAEITDHKRAEAALRESEQRYRTLFETMDQGFCLCEMLFDENGKPTDYRFLEVNPVFETMTGLEQATGKTARELVPNLEAHWFEIYGRVVLTGEPVRFENQSEAMDRWFDASAFRVGEPQSHKFAILFTNITDRKQAEMALRESEERFRSMADNAPFMVWVTDSTGYCTYLSQSWYDFTGQTEESGLGLGWVNATHPDDRQYAERTFLEANERNAAFRLEYRLRRKNGEYIWVIDAANPWFGVDGQYKGYIGSVIDISDRKQAETERDRLLQLEQTARAEAEKANRIKDEFLAVLSHELRTPLNPILGWSKLLQNGKLDQAKTKQALTTIERNAKLQSELIEDLLDVSRILQGKLNLNVSPVKLASTIRAAIETVRLAAEAKSIAVIANLDTEVGQVSGDITRLQQVVWNLLSNAVKFTPAGGRVTVRLEQVENQAHITVSDTGKGIDPDFVPYMFDYFRQEDGATTRRFGGLGLGLAIVRHLVELHGGTVQADSPGVGLGATFTVKLPLMPIQPAVNLDRQSSESSLDLNGVQVLVIDDETDSREFVAFVLEQAGARVTTATSAGEGFAALSQSQPDVLLSDIGMPDMDGYMLIRQIRALPQKQGGQVPAIALTAYAGDFNQQQALAAGFQRHLAKPIEPGELLVIIASLVKRTRQNQHRSDST